MLYEIVTLIDCEFTRVKIWARSLVEAKEKAENKL
jgi:hypothetical protein